MIAFLELNIAEFGGCGGEIRICASGVAILLLRLGVVVVGDGKSRFTRSGGAALNQVRSGNVAVRVDEHRLRSGTARGMLSVAVIPFFRRPAGDTGE